MCYHKILITLAVKDSVPICVRNSLISVLGVVWIKLGYLHWSCTDPGKSGPISKWSECEQEACRLSCIGWPSGCEQEASWPLFCIGWTLSSVTSTSFGRTGTSFGFGRTGTSWDGFKSAERFSQRETLLMAKLLLEHRYQFVHQLSVINYQFVRQWGFIFSTASGALVVGGVRDICTMYVVSKPIPGDSFECSME